MIVPGAAAMGQINYLSIDVEDYFQVSAFEAVSPPSTWESREWRVERNTDRILELLAAQGVQATFFVLGWVAERCPGLIRRIAVGGHEVASHGYGHRRVYLQRRDEFRQDVVRSKALLEDLTATAVLGYRAPSYSISAATAWAFDELHAAGYRYDSSVFPIRHDLYGMADWPRFPVAAERADCGAWKPAQGAANGRPRLLEIPITTLALGGRNWPIAGGGYFRFFPYGLTRWGLQRINRLEARPFVFYLHPWELDPDQPRIAGAGWKSRTRHYLNLHRTEDRFRQLLQDFSFAPLRKLMPAGETS